MSAQKKPAPEEATKPTNAGMLFFQNPAALTLERHENAGVDTGMDFGFTKNANSMPLNIIEFVPAGKNYPILFTAEDSPVPIAALGMEQENYFVDAKGNWQAGHYVPAYARQYPFAFYQQPDDDKLYLCVDEGSDKFQAKAKKDALKFYENGEPTEGAKGALEFCKAYFQHMQKTREFCDDLTKHKLLNVHHSRATVNGKEVQLTGFQMIDEKAFNALADDVILEFRKKGWLGFIYAALASYSNWNSLIATGNTSQ